MYVEVEGEIKQGHIWEHGQVIQRFEEGEVIALIPGIGHAFFKEVTDEGGCLVGYEFDGLVEDWEDGLDI